MTVRTHCKSGHLWIPDNWWVREAGHGVRCKICAAQWQRENRQKLAKFKDEDRAQTRRIIELACGHETVFLPVLPAKGELVLCRRCDDYAAVEKWGKRLPKQTQEQTDEG